MTGMETITTILSVPLLKVLEDEILMQLVTGLQEW